MVPAAAADPVSVAIGDFGAWQARSLLLLFLVKIPAGWHMLSILFLAPFPETFGGSYICARDDDPANLSLADWIQTKHPVDQRYPSGFNPCYVYSNAINESTAANAYNVEKCEKFEFFVDLPTMVTEWSLVCERSVLVSLIQSLYIFGTAIGGVVTFFSLKIISPKTLIMVGTALQVSAGIAGALQPIFEVHCLLKLLIGLGTCLMFTAANQIIVDISTGWRKTVFSVSFEFFWSVGVITLGWLDAAADSWSTLHLTFSIPSIIFILIWSFFPESPRWLIAHGRFDNADNLLKFVANYNGRDLPEDFTTKKPLIASPGSTICQKLPKFRVFCLQIMWIGTVVHYYGALYNIRNVGGPTLPIRTSFAGAAEIIGTVIGLFLLLKSKHKFGTLSLLLLIGGTSCATSFAIPPNASGSTSGWTMLGLAIVGRISVASSLAVMTNGSLELLPGDRRPTVGLAMVTVARLLLMTAPFLSTLAFYGESITLTFHGCLASIAAFGAFGIFLTAEWRGLQELLSKKVFNPQEEPKRSSEDDIVVCTYFNPQCEEFITSISA
ncbi:Hypothetical predicted protein [Cloeon dipterum]|uniref:Major facilitator superfamily (MFS) profile domain-containing protein n=1 Tax=Cloeon dipterum TaxID=197152 RepID=A0A8S1CYP5_9INSE|nr:Hypothetical predicted protein [Cloeon dipterum]